MKNRTPLKILVGCILTAFFAFSCSTSTDSTATTATTTTSTTCSSTTSTVLGCVGDNSSNLVTVALAKSAKFTKGLTVFGINILATSGVEDAKLLHAANITAELLDNDENGTVDNADVVNKLVSLVLQSQCIRLTLMIMIQVQ